MRASVLVLALGAIAACGGDDDTGPPEPLDPDTAPRVVVDRFSGEMATLFNRADTPSLPAADAPIDFDAPPFLLRGLGPGGEHTTHYLLDVRPRNPVNIYVMYREGDELPLYGQLPLADYVPGVHGYTDFWRLVRVDVPADYVVNSVTSTGAINVAGYPTTVTDKIINCPVVPVGSTATRRRGSGVGDTDLHRGWYKDQVFYYFTFEEVPLTVDGSDVPMSTVYTAFNVNPPAAGGGWPSGVMTEAGSDLTHTVAAALDGPTYSSLWSVQVYDNAAFASVGDLATAQAATVVVPDAALWNAPIVEVAVP